jgi:hypothetical protein
MSTLKVPPGDERVALGAKPEHRSTTQASGEQPESEYTAKASTPTRRQSLTLPIRIITKRGSRA